MAVATYFENAGQDASSHGGQHAAEVPTSNVPPRQERPIEQPQPQRGAYTLSGQAAEPLPAGWGSGFNRCVPPLSGRDRNTRSLHGLSCNSSNNSRPGSANRNPLRSNTGPRVTGFRDLASSSAPSFGGPGDDSDDDDDGSKDPANFYTGGAKSCAFFFFFRFLFFFSTCPSEKLRRADRMRTRCCQWAVG